MVGNSDIIRPDIILPLTQPKNTTKDHSAVDSNPHIHVYTSRFPNFSTKQYVVITKNPHIHVYTGHFSTKQYTSSFTKSLISISTPVASNTSL